MNRVPRKQDHNVGTHEEKMAKRRTLQKSREASVTVRTGKYTPRTEDVKHYT